VYYGYNQHLATAGKRKNILTGEIGYGQLAFKKTLGAGFPAFLNPKDRFEPMILRNPSSPIKEINSYRGVC